MNPDNLLLFMLFIGLLAEAIRINPDVSGVRVGDETSRIYLFADDILYLKKTEVNSIDFEIHIWYLITI